MNLGWMRDGINYKVSVPDLAYFITDRNDKEMASLNKAQCILKNGFQLCRSRDVVINHQSSCMSDILFKSDTTNCQVRVGRKIATCEIHRFLSGVFFSACDQLTVIKNFRGISKTMVIKPPKDQSVYYQNSEFDQIIAGKDVVTSKGDFLHTIVRNEVQVPDLGGDDIRHLMIPGIEHDLDSLRNLNSALRNTAEGVLREYDSKYSHFIWPSLILGTVLIFGYIAIRLLTKKNPESQDKSWSQFPNFIRSQETEIGIIPLMQDSYNPYK